MSAPIGQSMTDSMQSITVRNKLGEDMVENALQVGVLKLFGNADGIGSHEQFAISTVQSDAIITSLVEDNSAVKEKGLPIFIGEVMAFLLTNIGPKGINFAKYSIDYRKFRNVIFKSLNILLIILSHSTRYVDILRNYLYCLYHWGPEKTNESLPLYARDIVDMYLQYEVISKLVDKIKDNDQSIKNK